MALLAVIDFGDEYVAGIEALGDEIPELAINIARLASYREQERRYNDQC